MAAIVIKAFGGLKPLVSPYLLQSGDAQIAENVRLVSGSLVPLNAASTLKPLTKVTPATIFRYGSSTSDLEYWLEFATDTDVINSPIPNDPHGRAYWTDGGTPKYAPSNLILSTSSYPGGSYTLGIPAPISAPSVSQSSYGKATATITATQVSSLAAGNVLAVSVNGAAATNITIASGAVTAATLAAQLNTVAGLDATATGGTVKLETESGTVNSAILVEKQVTGGFDTLVSVSNDVSTDSETRAYTYTYVSAFGEEGPPSPPSSLLTVIGTGDVSVGNLSQIPGGSYNITAKRIYRSSTVGSQAQYQFVAEVPVATSSYTDSKTQSDLGEVLPSQDWLPPPSGLKGLKMMANGAAVAFKDNTLYLSEPNLPHAWPHKYPVDFQIVGVSPFRQSVAVLTTGYPFLASGADPSAMSLERLEFPHACLSKQSIVDTGDGCLYAGADGVVSIGAGGMKIVSDQLFTREQWQKLNPSTMRAFFHDSRYHVLYQNRDNVRGMLIFDFSGQGAMLTTSNINFNADISAGYSDPRTDTLYFAQGGFITRYNASSEPLSMTWRTGVFRLVKPVNFSYASVRAQAYPVTFRAYNERAPSGFTKVVSSANAFRLPAGFAASEWQFQVEGSKEVTLVAVAQSAAELQAIA